MSCFQWISLLPRYKGTFPRRWKMKLLSKLQHPSQLNSSVSGTQWEEDAGRKRGVLVNLLSLSLTLFFCFLVSLSLAWGVLPERSFMPALENTQNSLCPSISVAGSGNSGTHYSRWQSFRPPPIHLIWPFAGRLRMPGCRKHPTGPLPLDRASNSRCENIPRASSAV